MLKYLKRTATLFVLIVLVMGLSGVTSAQDEPVTARVLERLGQHFRVAVDAGRDVLRRKISMFCTEFDPREVHACSMSVVHQRQGDHRHRPRSVPGRARRRQRDDRPA